MREVIAFTLPVTLSGCWRVWDSKDPMMDVRQWPLRASRTCKGYSPFGRLVSMGFLLNGFSPTRLIAKVLRRLTP
ncbi:hypothetical protein EMIT0373P_50298 [Pseudomonas chlororaphis]